MQNFVQGRVTICCDITFNAYGIHYATVGQHNRLLLREERLVEIAFGNAVIRTAVERSDDWFGLFRTNFLVKHSRRIRLHQGSLTAKPQATHSADFDPVIQPGCCHGFFEPAFYRL